MTSATATAEPKASAAKAARTPNQDPEVGVEVALSLPPGISPIAPQEQEDTAEERRALYEWQRPSPKEETALKAIEHHEHEARLARKVVEREQAKRGLTPTNGLTGPIGSKTLADLSHGPPAPQLVDPFLTPEGVTVLYGPGGVGKGMVSVHFALQLVRAGLKVMVLDFETHQAEWGTRSRGMGFTEDELHAVQYREPYGESWEAPTGPLIEIAPTIRDDCTLHEIDYLIVDSVSAATSNADSMGGKTPAEEFFRGLRIIGRPAAAIAHVTGSSNRFPDRPFGSVFFHNFARETWAVENTDQSQDEITFDPTTDPLQPAVLSLELRNKKMNVGRRVPPQFLTFSFFFDHHIEVDTRLPANVHTLADMTEEILRRAEHPLDLNGLTKAIKNDYDTTVKPDNLRKTMNRQPLRFRRLATVPFTWELA